MKKQRILFLGPPGAGKGTQASMICESDDICHLSTGDLLRAEVASGTSLGKQASLVMSKGELVGDSLVLSIVEKKLSNISKGWLLDGYPRNINQAKALGELLHKLKQPIQVVVLFEIDDDLLVQRLLGRGRSDDNEEVIRHRLRIYKEKTTPLIDYYSKDGLLKFVKGDGEVSEISKCIEEILS